MRSENNEELTVKEESTDIPPMPPLESDEEETKEGEGWKILTPSKGLTRLSKLLAQIKAGKNVCKLIIK